MVVLVTGFGPFLSVAVNPSAILAESSGLPHQVLEVSYSGVESALDAFDPDSFERLLMIGVAQQSEKMRIELVARNTIGATPDVLGMVHGPGPIDPAAPFQLAGTLWKGSDLLNESKWWMPSVDAGGYLCNYIYFRALQRFPDKSVGFLHVPPSESLDIESQRRALSLILEALGADAA